MRRRLRRHAHDVVEHLALARDLRAGAAFELPEALVDADEIGTPLDLEVAAELDELISAIDQDARREHAAYMRRRDSILKLCENPTLGEVKPAAVA